ncbi:MAG: T9SS type A sorting domain-containing protein [Candidatus Cloacimonetes bacterium]|nr:T9SS type A sorting domain-containing protein [Candidatus Cloacimonadota bacterium]
MKITMLFLGIFLIGSLFSQVTLDPRYHTNEEILEELTALQEEFPDIVYLTQIGTTLTDDLPIWAIKLSDNASTNEDEPAVMFAGQCHAEEVLGVEITMWMIDDIIQHRFQTPYSIWLQYTEMWFVPTYNPEGLQVVMDGLDDSWRKNKRDNNENGILDLIPGPGNDIDGVDTNRNYGFNWVHGDTLYSTNGEELYDYYRGPAPFSEGGTQAIRSLSEDEHFIFSINWHSSRTGNFSEKAYYSFEWAGQKFSPDFALNELICTTVAGLIENETGTGHYMSLPSLGRKGSAHDWFYKAHGTTQFLIECGTENLQPPEELIEDTCERCSVGAYWLINRVLGYQASGAMLTGHITDENTGEPLVAEIIVQENNASFFDPRKSDPLYGRFWRPLMPGSYTIQIRKKGYEEQIISNVTINNSGWTDLDISLTPLSEAIVNGSITYNATPLNGEIVIFGLENDTILFENGTYNLNVFEGALDLLIIAEGYLPKYYSTILNAGNHVINLTLPPFETIFSENWESGLDDWTISGDWSLSDEANDGLYSLRNTEGEFYSNDSDHIIQLNLSFDLQNQTAAMLSFWQKYHIEHDNDLAKVEVSQDGTEWIILKEFSGVFGWHQQFLSLNEFLEGNLYLRFHFQSDSTIDDPGWWIDDIKLMITDLADSSNSNVSAIIPVLQQNYPNPFNPTTTISFTIPEISENTEISIYNLKGQKVRTLLNEKLEGGKQSLIWQGKDDNEKGVTSGIYFYKIKSGTFSATKKMIMIK